VRLGILAVLAEADQADFGYLKETLELSDGNLSRHLRVLEEAGYVRIGRAIGIDDPARGCAPPSPGGERSMPI
jgi:DNA-binding transcriptional ArsR family regulator